MEEDKKFLSQEQLFKMQDMHKDQLIAKKDLDYACLELKKADTELTLLSANYTLKTKEIEERKLYKNEMKKELLERKNRGKGLVQKIRKDFELNENWGYDPLTGEIKDE